MKYRSEIDGLRAVAVLPVIFFHAGFQGFSGGFVGVDVFFVISGFLITNILLDDLRAGQFSIIRFYERRARRLLPAISLVMLCCLPAGWLLLMPDDFRDFMQSVAATSVFSSNFLFWIESGYFDQASELKPLIHSWSLAVEEQFYLIFPPLLWLVWSWRRSALMSVMLLLAGSSFMLALWMQEYAPSASFFLAPMRAWELLAGTLLALYAQDTKGTKHAGAFSLIGLALIIFSIVFYDAGTPFPSVYTLVPVIGTLLVLNFASDSTFAGRLLSSPAFVGIGLISYSAYLWHQPIFAFLRTYLLSEPDSWLSFAAIAITLMLAYFSWRFIERPFRNPKIVSRKFIFSLSAVSVTFFFSIGAAVHHFRWEVESVWIASQPPQAQKAYQLVVEAARDAPDLGVVRTNPLADEDCRFMADNIETDIQAALIACEKQFGSGVLVFGDSHARDMFGVAQAASDTPFLIGLTKGGCGLHNPDAACYYEGLIHFLEEHPNIFEQIFYVQAGHYLLRQRAGEGTRTMFSARSLDQPVDGIYPNENAIKTAFANLKRFKSNANLTWLAPRIEMHIPLGHLVRTGCDTAFKLRDNQAETFIALEQAILYEREALKISEVSIASQIKLFDLDPKTDFGNCQQLYWSDGDHFSAAGERYFAHRLPTDFFEAKN